MSETAQHSKGAQTNGRPGWLLPVAVVAAVVVVAGIVVGIVLAQRPAKGTGAAQTPVSAATVLLPSPTPTVAPVARQATSAFAKALPTSVLRYALASSAVDAEWQKAGAIEAWDETYTDGASGTLTLRAGQWETADEAKAFAATLLAAVPTPAATPATPATGATTATASGLPRSGDVTVGGATVGTFSVVDAGNGNGIAVWTNGQSVFWLSAPLADAYAAYTAFPL